MLAEVCFILIIVVLILAILFQFQTYDILNDAYEKIAELEKKLTKAEERIEELEKKPNRNKRRLLEDNNHENVK